jgi:hypothetical protein
MKHSSQILLLAACASLQAWSAAQTEVKSPSQVADFVTDASKPYVYLDVDHVGPRKPMREGEPDVGIYLHLTNNCALPIVIVALEVRPANPNAAINIEDEVVPDPHGPGGDGIGGGNYAQSGVPGLKEMDDIFISPNVNEAEVTSAELGQKRGHQGPNDVPARPHGYNSGYEPGFRMLALIPPGGRVFFSVPANHVSTTWHFEIPFRLAVPNKSRIRPPYSYLAFYQQDLNGQTNTVPSMPTTH